MATYYFVGSNWDNSEFAWALTSGGVGIVSSPTIGDDVIFEWYEFGVMPEKIECKIVYINAAFYVASNLLINEKPAVEKTIASILENNAQVPKKHPIIFISKPDVWLQNHDLPLGF